MEVDGIESSVEKPSITNDAMENAVITKSVSTFSDNKDFEVIPNDLANSVDLHALQNETLRPPNGEQESFSNTPPERDGLEKPVYNANVESHLESNINIIENQNNENLERDNELMETESIDPTSSIEESTISETIDRDCASKDSSENVCTEGESVEPTDVSIDISADLRGVALQTDTEQDIEECQSKPLESNPIDADSNKGEVSNISDPVLENVSKQILEKITEPVLESVCEPVLENISEPVLENISEPVLESVSEPVLESVSRPVLESISRPVLEGISEPVLERISEPVSEPVLEGINEPVLESISERVLDSINEPVLESISDTLNLVPNIDDPEGNTSDAPKDMPSEDLSEDLCITNIGVLDSEEVQPELLRVDTNDILCASEESLTAEQIDSDVKSPNEKNQDEDPIVSETVADADYVNVQSEDKTASADIEYLDNIIESQSPKMLEPSQIETSAQKDSNIDQQIQQDTEGVTSESESVSTNVSEVERPEDPQIPPTTSDKVMESMDIVTLSAEKNPEDEAQSGSSGDTESSKSIQENTGIEKDSIEFAQVNFNVMENEKETERPSSSGRGTELDPIAAVPDVLDSIADSEGADEAITIIPDSEREITEAEKEAASSLPTLKDISDKTQTPDIDTLEINSCSDSEIKIYKYDKELQQDCCQCKETKSPKYHFSSTDQDVTYICDDTCLGLFKNVATKKVTVVTDEGTGLRVKNFMEGPPKEPPSLAFIRKCASCSKVTDDIESNLTWEIMDFCNEFCLSKYQKINGSKCASCSGDVKSTSLGKYCVRFGNDIRQFCTSTCLEQYKKGLKVCSYCQQDMSNGPDGFLAPVGEKGQFKDFCSRVCMEKYDIMTNDRPPNVEPGTICSVCKTEKPISIEYEHNDNLNYFCGEPCFVAFAFVNKISPGKCAMCRRHFNKTVLEQHTMYYDNVQYSFCSNSCENIYIIAHRKIVPCSWCKVKKYNFDMIKKYSKTAPVINMCSINCLNMYQVSLNAVNATPSACHFCKKQASPAYHLTMSDATMRNFCSYGCVMSFQNQFPKQITLNSITDPIPAGAPQKTKRGTTIEIATSTINDSISQLPVISSVQSLATTNGATTPPLLPPGLTPISSTRLTRSKATTSTSLQQSTAVQNVQNIDLPVQVQIKQHYIIKERPYVEQRNVGVMCQPRKTVKATQSTPTTKSVGIQTDREDIKKILVPIPVPIYVPTPCHMFSTPVPIPVPFPLPIPIPIFIPTTRNSSAGIMKEIKKIQVKIPTDPYEAELLMMAEMVAEEKKEEHTDSESDLDDNAGDGGGEYSPEPVDANNTFGDDMLQMALKMATELDEPAVDLEGALTANTITAPQGSHPQEPHPQEENVDDPQPIHPHLMERSPLRGRKRGMRGAPRGSQSKRGRRMSHHQVDMPMLQPPQASAPPEPQEKPDANMCLKYTFGVNAWKQWVTTKNAELEKSSRRMKLFKTEILQLTADELNYSLCLFVKEVRKPNGQEYAPDTIYYLCLGIQQYLFENGRIDNIFCDPYYEKFTDCLDEVAKKFSVLYNDSHYIVTRVEEEHLWESKQLGAHSPHVLLSTLMFFNTKHFNLTTVDEHMQLSFSHIMKHWKRNPNQPGASKVPGSRNVLLRFYPPQSALQNNQRKKKVYEQQENEENPLRCPVKLYEFYLSKCPESVKTRNDVFYLQPERSCVPDSPVWYSTMPLPKEALEKMLHRVKMVKEINVALLTS